MKRGTREGGVPCGNAAAVSLCAELWRRNATAQAPQRVCYTRHVLDNPRQREKMARPMSEHHRSRPSGHNGGWRGFKVYCNVIAVARWREGGTSMADGCKERGKENTFVCVDRSIMVHTLHTCYLMQVLTLENKGL